MTNVKTWNDVIEDMKSCEQTKGQSVLDHGLSVWKYTDRLLKGDFDGMRIPDWFIENHTMIVDESHPVGVIYQYTVHHDIGKPYCLIVDDDGSRHFPDHANVSQQTWLEHNELEDEADAANIARLIGLDMVLHTETAEQIKERNLSKEDALTLILVACAELHSNADMFGGIDSISFKSKWKKWNKRGKMLIKMFDTDS